MINVTLHASYPPTLPGHICDWTITSVTGELLNPNSTEYTQWLENLPSRIETVSVLNNLAFHHIMKALVACWIVGLWYRMQQSFAAYEQGEARVRVMIDAATLFAIYRLAQNDMLKSCVAVAAYWASMSKEQPDVVPLVLVFTLAFNNCMVAGICLSVAYTSWAVLRLVVPWRDMHSGLPNYEGFRARLRRVRRLRRQGRAGVEDGECIICWSTDELPFRLPCRRTHVVCAECLGRLHDSFQNKRPFCRQRLWAMESVGGDACELIMSCFAASCGISPVLVALTCYKESSFWATVAILLTASITMPIVLDVWHFVRTPPTANEEYMQTWVLHMAMRHAFFAITFGCWSVWQIWKLDKVTFVDGVLVGELEVWMGHSFFWEP